jgi:hypothetical protein
MDDGQAVQMVQTSTDVGDLVVRDSESWCMVKTRGVGEAETQPHVPVSSYLCLGSP